MEAKQRFYFDGQLKKTGNVRGIEELRRMLDRQQKSWQESLDFGGGFLCQPGEFDPNNAYTVTRISIDELIVVTTGNHTLRTINVPVGEKAK